MKTVAMDNMNLTAGLHVLLNYLILDKHSCKRRIPTEFGSQALD